VKYLFSFLLIPLLFSFRYGEPPDHKAAKILQGMYDSIHNIKTLRLKIVALERIETSYISATSEFKLNIQPRKLYFINRAKKLEILYNTELSRKAIVKPHIFPYLTLNLDPMGNLMRRNQHYTINELGYDFTGKAIAFTLSKDKNGFNNLTYHGKVMKNGYHCHLLEYENKNFGYTDYVVGEKETASLISAKLVVHDYLLKFKNDLLNDFGYLKKGSTIKVPTLYCKRALVYLDEKLLLPVSLSLYDDVGLVESYDFFNIDVNRPFKDEEFRKGYHEYRF
jgi:hypothetical protein